MKNLVDMISKCDKSDNVNLINVIHKQMEILQSTID